MHRTDRMCNEQMPMWVKWVAPAAWLASIIGLFGTDLGWRTLFALPFVLALAFHVWLASVDVRDGRVRYHPSRLRRLFTAKTMRKNPANTTACQCRLRAAGVRHHGRP